jgi:phosphoribosylaminoimidazole carboxylase PurE protein
MKAKPELKIKEFSKQYVRDALLEMGFNPEKDKVAPKLSEEHVVECSYRYISIYERITGQQFEFPTTRIEPSKRIVTNLQRAGILKGAFVGIFAGSDSDMPHLENIAKELAKFKIPSQIRICSAHKQPGRLQAVLAHYDKSAEPMLIVGCAGGTDALSGTASYLSRHPVVSCPPDGMNQTCLTNPPGSSNAFIVKPSNVAKFAAQFFAHSCPEVSTLLDASIREKIRKLEEADDRLVKKARTA